MKTRRTRMLIIFMAAALVISFFTHWQDFATGFLEGFNDGQQVDTK